MQIPTNQVVRGDVVVLGTGDVVPADRGISGAADQGVAFTRVESS